jgi:MFS family permease
MRKSALRHAPLRTYLIGNFFGLNGVWMQRVAIGWMAWDLTGSPAWTGLVAFLNFAPAMVSGPFFGVLADRVDVRRAIVGVQMGQAALAATLLALLLSGLLDRWTLSALALVIGIVYSAYHPLRMSLIPRLVPRESLAQAVALTSINFNFSRMSGPALGGWLIHEWGVAAALMVNIALYLPQIIALAALPAQRPAARGPDSRRFLQELGDGARIILASREILQAMAITAVFGSIVRGALEILPAVSGGMFDRGAAGLGALTAAAGAGAVLSSILMARRGGDEGLIRISYAAAIVGLWLTAMLAETENWSFALLMVGGMGFASAMAGVANLSIVQLNIEDSVRGRVMSLWTVVGIGGASLGALALGAAGSLIGLRLALAAASLAGAALLVAFGARAFLRRR